MTPAQLTRRSNIDSSLIALLTGTGAGALFASLGNWASITAIASGEGVVQVVPHSQTTPSDTAIAAIAMTPRTSGIFLVGCDVAYADNTTADSVTHQLVSVDGTLSTSTTLAGTGFSAEGIFGPATTVNGIAANAGVLGADAAGGVGITFAGVGIGGESVAQSVETTPTLTGLLTGAAQNFRFMGIVHSLGPTSNTKTPFNVGKACCFGLTVGATHVITYASLQLWAVELPFG